MKLFSKYVRVLAFAFFFLLFSAVFGQSSSRKTGLLYQTGYRGYKVTDSSRRYKPGAGKGSPLFFRPVEFDLWYPALNSSGHSPLNHSYFLSLFERRANSFQDSVKYEGLAGELSRHFSIGNSSSVSSGLTNSYLDITSAKGNFPIIIYLCSYNGMSYENVPLFENLASHGFVVVSISSVGRYPGNMSTKAPDILEQVADAEYAIQFLRNRDIDSSEIGLIGYSYGGIAAVLMAMKHPSIKSILSLDGSEKHYYGRDSLEDKGFDDLRNSVYWNPSALKIPYAYLESDSKEEEGSIDSILILSVDKAFQYARLNGSKHEDFSSVSMPVPKPGSIYEMVNHLSLGYFNQTLKMEGQPFNEDLIFFKAAKRIAAEPQTTNTKSRQIILKGRIVSEQRSEPLPYAGIGIPSGSLGTISDYGGYFTLSLPDTLMEKRIRISALGYKSKTYTVRELVSDLVKRPVLSLSEQPNELKEVVISTAKPRTKILGNTSQSKFFNVGFPFRDLGSEVGIKISLGKKKVLLRNFSFNISEMRMDSCTFRLNIYAVKDDLLGENLLKQNILKTIGNKPGAYTIDLAACHIALHGTILVSLEWIDGKTSAKKGTVFFSAGLLSSSYHRKTTEADWNKFKGLGAAFNLKVMEE